MPLVEEISKTTIEEFITQSFKDTKLVKNIKNEIKRFVEILLSKEKFDKRDILEYITISNKNQMEVKKIEDNTSKTTNFLSQRDFDFEKFKSEIDNFIKKYFIDNQNLSDENYKKDLAKIAEIIEKVNDPYQKLLMSNCLSQLNNLQNIIKTNSNETLSGFDKTNFSKTELLFAEIKKQQILHFTFKYKQILQEYYLSNVSHIMFIKNMKSENEKVFLPIYLLDELNKDQEVILTKLRTKTAKAEEKKQTSCIFPAFNKKLIEVQGYALISWENEKNEIVEGLINVQDFLFVSNNFCSLLEDFTKVTLLDDNLYKTIKEVIPPKNLILPKYYFKGTTNGDIVKCLKVIDDIFVTLSSNLQDKKSKILISNLVNIKNQLAEYQTLNWDINEKLWYALIEICKNDIAQENVIENQYHQQSNGSLEKGNTSLSNVIQTFLPFTKKWFLNTKLDEASTSEDQQQNAEPVFNAQAINSQDIAKSSLNTKLDETSTSEEQQQNAELVFDANAINSQVFTKLSTKPENIAYTH